MYEVLGFGEFLRPPSTKPKDMVQQPSPSNTITLKILPVLANKFTPKKKQKLFHKMLGTYQTLRTIDSKVIPFTKLKDMALLT